MCFKSFVSFFTVINWKFRFFRVLKEKCRIFATMDYHEELQIDTLIKHNKSEINTNTSSKENTYNMYNKPHDRTWILWNVLSRLELKMAQARNYFMYQIDSRIEITMCFLENFVFDFDSDYEFIEFLLADPCHGRHCCFIV